MRARWMTLIAAGCVLMAAPLASQAAAQRGHATAAPAATETGAKLVTFAREKVPHGFADAIAREGGSVLFNLESIGVAVVFGLPEGLVRHLASERAAAEVASDVWIPMAPVGVEDAPAGSLIDEPLFDAQWGVRLVRADLAIESGFTGDGARIAIIDSGLYYDHPDLAPNYGGGVNFFAPFCDLDPSAPPSACDPIDPQDTNGHGTMVAGIAAAALNGVGIVGVAPDAELLALKACGFPFPGACPLSAVVAGIYHAANIGVDVINLSLNCVVELTCPDEEGLVKALRRATSYARRKGALVVTISQNNGLDLDAEGLRLAIGEANRGMVVSAVGPDAESATFEGVPYSNIGRVVDIAAPGGSFPGGGVLSTWSPLVPPLPSTDPSGLYAVSGGTSFAAPHVSGAAAQLVGHFGRTRPQLLKLRLQQRALDLGDPGRDPVFGHGLVDVWEALIP